MHVAVCIVAFRNGEDLARCCAALEAQTHADFAVYICENGGAESHDALAATLPARLKGRQPLTLLRADDNPGFAAGINRCMTASPDADAWWVLNPDTIPSPEALATLVARLSVDDCDLAGGVLHDDSGTVQTIGGRWRPWLARCESLGRGWSLAKFPSDLAILACVERSMDYVSGASMLVGRRFRERVGLMREDYFLYAEEVEWCLRGKAQGMRLGLAVGAHVMHGQGGSTGSADPIARRPKLPIYLDERNKLNVVRDTSPHRLPVAILTTLALLTLRYAVPGALRQWRYALAGWWSGVRAKRGKPAWFRSSD